VYWPKHLLERLDPKKFWDWEFWTHPVGNGPYRYVRHVPNTMVELEANPDFFAGKPKIEHVFIKFGGATEVTELLSGNVDIITKVNQATIPKLAADPRFRVYHHLGRHVPWLKALVWNHRHPLFADARVRRALTSAIDRRELLRLLNLPPDLPLTDALFTPRQYHRGELPAPIPHEPETARALLAEAGWRDTDGDGIRERGGRPCHFTTLVAFAEDEAVAVYVQAALRRVGVEMRVERLEMSVQQRRLRTGAFEAAIVAFWNHVDSHVQWLGAGLERGDESEEFGSIGYRNAEVARLLDEAKQTADPDAQDRIYRQLAPIISADVPITFLFPRLQTYVVHRRVRGLESPFRADPMRYMERLWIER
jgi:peptide/nickel transport system substrate-binding protein